MIFTQGGGLGRLLILIFLMGRSGGGLIVDSVFNIYMYTIVLYIHSRPSISTI